MVDKMLKYRAAHNLSQEKFAKLCGLTKATVNNLESGKSKGTKLTWAKIERIINLERED